MIEIVVNDDNKMKFDYKTYAIYHVQEKKLSTRTIPEIVFRVPKVVSSVNDIHAITRDGRMIDTHSLDLMRKKVFHIITNDPSPIYNTSVGESLSILVGDSKTAIDPTSFYLMEVVDYGLNKLSDETIKISRDRDTTNEYHTIHGIDSKSL